MHLYFLILIGEVKSSEKNKIYIGGKIKILGVVYILIVKKIILKM